MIYLNNPILCSIIRWVCSFAVWKQLAKSSHLQDKPLMEKHLCFLPMYSWFLHIRDYSFTQSNIQPPVPSVPHLYVLALPFHLGSSLPSHLLSRLVLTVFLNLVLPNKFLRICFYVLSVTSPYLYCLLILVKYNGSKLLSSQTLLLVGGRENGDEKWVWLSVSARSYYG